MYKVCFTTDDTYVDNFGDEIDPNDKIGIYGAFDPASWNDEALKNIVSGFSTISAKCEGDDKDMLTNLINGRGGFDRLDSIVKKVREQSIKDLEAANLFEQLFSISISSVETFGEALV